MKLRFEVQYDELDAAAMRWHIRTVNRDPEVDEDPFNASASGATFMEAMDTVMKKIEEDVRTMIERKE